MMQCRLTIVLAVTFAASVALACPAEALAQPADLPIPAATTNHYPPGVRIGSDGGTPVYVTAEGRTLYGMDMRTLLRAGADPSQYCRAVCMRLWEPLLAPAGFRPNIAYPPNNGDRRRALEAGVTQVPAAPDKSFYQNQKAPDWSVIQGPAGPQWVYKGWHMVFTRKDGVPDSAVSEDPEDLVWNSLKYVPSPPKLTAPVGVATTFLDRDYALVAPNGNLLFAGNCSVDCASWDPFGGPMASSGIGDWTVDRAGDAPQWLYRGHRVYVAGGGDRQDIPSGGDLLRP